MTPPRTFPIRLHLILFSLLVLGPTLFMSGVISYRYASSARLAIREVAQDKAADLQRAIDRQADVAIASLKALATSPALDAGDWHLLQAQVQGIPQLAAGTVALCAGDGSPIWSSGPGPADAADAAALAGLWNAATPDGARREVAVSGFVDAADGSGPVRVVVPVRRDGGPARLLVWTIGAGAFAGVIPALESEWLGVIVDRDYRVVARSRDNAVYAGRQASPTFTRQISGDTGALTSRTLDGIEVLTAFQRSPVTGWMALVSVPRTELARPFQALLWSIGALIAVGAALSGALAYAYSRLLGRELGSLSTDAASVAEGRPIAPAASRISEVAAVHAAMADAAGRIAEGHGRQRVLLAELNHRVKNTLAVIQTLIGRTVTAGRSPEEASGALRGRVAALAAAHDALSDSEWQDPDLEHVVRRVLGSRHALVGIAGPAVLLRPRTVVALSQALNEVITASLDAGALRRAGHPELSWAWAGAALEVRWFDPAGPEGTPPAPTGFAATVIQLCIERQLGGRAEADRTATGLAMTWTIPATGELGQNLAASPGNGAETGPGSAETPRAVAG